MKKELWKRLKEYRFQNLAPVSLADRISSVFGGPDPFTRAFAAKIAKKHGWTTEFAYLAIREYKKFVFLGVTSHYAVTPSKIIDIVWHEHLHFTRGYREFCQDVLQHFFDHSPELIAFDEQTNVFNAQYQKTLDFYEYEFGMKPPPEIWGYTKFDPKSVTKKIDKPRKKTKDNGYSSSSDSDVPIYQMFPADSPHAPIPVVFEGGGGDMGGAGATGGWDAPSAPADSAPSAPSTPSCSSAPSAPSCSSGTSSCSSSSCGGGGCGGS